MHLLHPTYVTFKPKFGKRLCFFCSVLMRYVNSHECNEFVVEKKKKLTYLNKMDGEYGRLNVVLSASFPFEMKLLSGIIFQITYSVVKTHRQGLLSIILMSCMYKTLLKCFFCIFE